MVKKEAEKLAYSTYHWLEFQITCGREMLLSESYLSQPIGEYLSFIHNGDIRAEWTHPNFQNLNTKGRPKQVDYALFSSSKNRPVCAIEAKWVGDKKVQKQRIIDDIIRLDCIRNPEGQGMVRYFIVAGLRKKYTENLTSLQIQSDGIRTNFLTSILPNDIGADTRYKVLNCENSLKKFYRSFATNYSIDIPKSYKAEKLSDVHRKDSYTRVTIWKISSSSNRQTFNPEDQWQ